MSGRDNSNVLSYMCFHAISKSLLVYCMQGRNAGYSQMSSNQGAPLAFVCLLTCFCLCDNVSHVIVCCYTIGYLSGLNKLSLVWFSFSRIVILGSSGHVIDDGLVWVMQEIISVVYFFKVL